MIFLPYGGFFDPRDHMVSSFSPVTWHTFVLSKRTRVTPSAVCEASKVTYTLPKRESGLVTPLSPFIELQVQEVQWNYFPIQEGTLDCQHLSLDESCSDGYKSPPNSPEHQDSWISSLLYGYRWW